MTVSLQKKQTQAKAAEKVFCSLCVADVSAEPYIRCHECVKSEVNICTLCFQLGSENGEHRRGHNYQVVHRCGPQVFTFPDGAMGSFEQKALLELIQDNKLEDW